jgi:hypothetical protein
MEQSQVWQVSRYEQKGSPFFALVVYRHLAAHADVDASTVVDLEKPEHTPDAASHFVIFDTKHQGHRSESGLCRIRLSNATPYSGCTI